MIAIDVIGRFDEPDSNSYLLRFLQVFVLEVRWPQVYARFQPLCMQFINNKLFIASVK